MLKAYNELYLYDAMRNLGEAFDYAINDCHITPNEFYDMFLVSGISKQFENENPKYVGGMSGTELVLNVFEKVGLNLFVEPQIDYYRSKEYWAGWVLAYFQWYTNKSFEYISEYITMEEIIEMYYPLHEASEDKFVDILNQHIQNKRKSSYLKLLREKNGLSHAKLAESSEVSLRMIQQYEQGAKDINKASGDNLRKLAKTLNCQIEDLLEK